MLGVMLAPILPESAEKIAAQLGTDCKADTFGAVGSYSVGEATPLFARIDTEKVLAELAKEIEAKMAAAKAENEKTAAANAAKAENLVTLEKIAIDDFAKVELRTAKVIACEPVAKSKKLLKITLDDGSGKERTVASGIAKWYTPEDLIGHTVIIVANLKPATLCGVESNGMILAADVGEDAKVIFADGIPAGSKIR